MIRRQEQLDIAPAFDFSYVAPKERLLFFDIETTGLKAGRSNVYLIGLVLYEEGNWVLRQYFSESMLEEQDLLVLFQDEISKKRQFGHPVLVSFNGEGFDINYLKETYREYNLPHPFTDTLSFDLYRVIRPWKKLTGLTSLKLKKVEELCGIFREDKYSGGELIYVYEEYQRLCRILPGGSEDIPQNAALRDHCLRTLLLHNEEDIRDLPLVMDICSYDRLMHGDFTLEKAEVLEKAGNGSEKVLNLRFRLQSPLPKEYFYEDEAYVISASGKDRTLLEIAVTLFTGELKFFYQDYKNYYYLPEEDMAIHKSVGEFVDRKSRKQATACTCYQKREGTFLPEESPVFVPVFYKAYKGRKYAEFTEEVLTQTEKIVQYAVDLLQVL